jgi:hypothetical protein
VHQPPAIRHASHNIETSVVSGCNRQRDENTRRALEVNRCDSAETSVVNNRRIGEVTSPSEVSKLTRPLTIPAERMKVGSPRIKDANLL